MSDIRFLLRLAGVRRRDLVAPILAGSVTLLTALGLAVLSGWLITRAWEMPPVLSLSVAVTSVRALGISRAVFRYLDRLVSHRLALDSLTTLRARVYDAQARAGAGAGGAGAGAGSAGAGSAGSAGVRGASRGEAQALLVADTERVTDVIVRCIVPVGVAVVLSVAAFVGALLLSPAAAAALLAGFLVTGFVVPSLAVRAARTSDVAAAENDFIAQLDSVLHDRVEFAAAGLGPQRVTRAAGASAQASRAWVESKRPEAVAAGLQAWATGLVAVAVTWVGVTTFAGSPGLSPTWLGMLVMLPLAAFEAHGPLPAAAVHLQQARGAASRLRAIVSAPQLGEVDRVASGAVRATELLPAYGDTPFTFDVPAGGRMVVRGPSGCGKTQMLMAVAGLSQPRSGTVTRPASATFFAEDAWIFSTTVRENLLVANPSATDALMQEALDAVGFEFSLGFLLSDGSASLSSGQRRRLLLARALVSDADVLLLDEPTEHLSPDSAHVLMRMLLLEPLPGAKPDRTVIVVAHTDGPVGVEAFPGHRGRPTTRRCEPEDARWAKWRRGGVAKQKPQADPR